MEQLKKHLGIFCNGILDRLLSILGAVGMAQFPQFFSQYTQRLGGHLQEAQGLVRKYQRAADHLGISLDQYIDHHIAADNPVFQSSGEVMVGMLSRVETLETAFNSLQQANPFTRWAVFLQVVDWEIAHQTLRNYTPGLPTSGEGIIYGIAGLLLGWGLYGAIRNSSCKLEKKIKNKGGKLYRSRS